VSKKHEKIINLSKALIRYTRNINENLELINYIVKLLAGLRGSVKLDYITIKCSREKLRDAERERYELRRKITWYERNAWLGKETLFDRFSWLESCYKGSFLNRMIKYNYDHEINIKYEQNEIIIELNDSWEEKLRVCEEKSNEKDKEIERLRMKLRDAEQEVKKKNEDIYRLEDKLRITTEETVRKNEEIKSLEEKLSSLKVANKEDKMQLMKLLRNFDISQLPVQSVAKYVDGDDEDYVTLMKMMKIPSMKMMKILTSDK
jgi:hypothetical protein